LAFFKAGRKYLQEKQAEKLPLGFFAKQSEDTSDVI